MLILLDAAGACKQNNENCRHKAIFSKKLLNIYVKTYKIYISSQYIRRVCMPIEWTPNLSVGVSLIDDQHKILFERANQLFEAGKERRAKEYISTMFDFLDEYTKQHFGDEEAYMEEIGYPQIEAQKRAHAHFINELARLKSEYEKSGGNALVIINANKFVVDWITNHIRTMDRKIGEYVQTL